MSMAEWPSGDHRRELFNHLVRLNEAYEKERENFKTFEDENFLQVRVMFERLNYREITEKLTYPVVKLLADIGGQLGLWIGISALTCCEFLELLLLLAQSKLKRKQNKNIGRKDRLEKGENECLVELETRRASI